MAMNSFDVVSEINWQEIDNAINQTRKEIQQRYDFKGSKSSIEMNQKDKTLTVLADDDYKLRSVVDILQNKFVKRSVPLKAFKYKEAEPAHSGMVRQVVDVLQGISKDNARMIVKMIKERQLKIFLADENADLDFAVQFVNYR